MSLKTEVVELITELEFVVSLIEDDDLVNAMEGLEGQSGRISAMVAEYGPQLWKQVNSEG